MPAAAAGHASSTAWSAWLPSRPCSPSAGRLQKTAAWWVLVADGVPAAARVGKLRRPACLLTLRLVACQPPSHTCLRCTHPEAVLHFCLPCAGSAAWPGHIARASARLAAPRRAAEPGRRRHVEQRAHAAAPGQLRQRRAVQVGWQCSARWCDGARALLLHAMVAVLRATGKALLGAQLPHLSTSQPGWPCSRQPTGFAALHSPSPLSVRASSLLLCLWKAVVSVPCRPLPSTLLPSPPAPVVQPDRSAAGAADQPARRRAAAHAALHAGAA